VPRVGSTGLPCSTTQTRLCNGVCWFGFPTSAETNRCGLRHAYRYLAPRRSPPSATGVDRPRIVRPVTTDLAGSAHYQLKSTTGTFIPHPTGAESAGS